MHDWDFALTDVGFQASRVEVLEVDFAPVRSACSAFGVGNMYSDTQTFLGCSTLVSRLVLGPGQLITWLEGLGLYQDQASKLPVGGKLRLM